MTAQLVEITAEQRAAFLQTIRDSGDEMIGNVAALRAVGVKGTRGQLHDLIDREGLKEEITEARNRNVEKVKQAVFQVACDPSHKDFQRCAAMWLKAHGGSEWSDRMSHEITGKNGGPIALLAGRYDLEQLTVDELEGLRGLLEKARPELTVGDADS